VIGLTQCFQDDISPYFLESKAGVKGHIIKGLAASGSSCPRHAGHNNIPMELAATLAKKKDITVVRNKMKNGCLHHTSDSALGFQTLSNIPGVRWLCIPS